MGTLIEGQPEIPRVFAKIDQSDADGIREMLDTAVAYAHWLGFGSNQIGVGFKIGLTGFALRAAGMDANDKSLSGPLNQAIDRAINETIAELRATHTTGA